jgi:hypothetical protein
MPAGASLTPAPLKCPGTVTQAHAAALLAALLAAPETAFFKDITSPVSRFKVVLPGSPIKTLTPDHAILTLRWPRQRDGDTQ